VESSGNKQATSDGGDAFSSSLFKFGRSRADDQKKMRKESKVSKKEKNNYICCPCTTLATLLPLSINLTARDQKCRQPGVPANWVIADHNDGAYPCMV
jgi:hypothetical protein